MACTHFYLKDDTVYWCLVLVLFSEGKMDNLLKTCSHAHIVPDNAGKEKLEGKALNLPGDLYSTPYPLPQALVSD